MLAELRSAFKVNHMRREMRVAVLRLRYAPAALRFAQDDKKAAFLSPS